MRRVAVNLLWCVPGEVGGSEDYLVRQLLGLPDAVPPATEAHSTGPPSTGPPSTGLPSTGLPADIEPTLFALGGFATAHPDLADLFDIVEAPINGASRPRRVLAEHTWLTKQTAASDLVHHGGGTSPARGTQPTLLTIHDLQYRTYPEYVKPLKRLYLNRAMPRSAKRATMIAVPSEYVRGTVIDAYGCDPATVVVVPHGMERTLGVGATPEADLRIKYALGDGPVIVLPAMTHPHKGHRFVLQVMARHWTDPSLRLILVGGAGAAEGDVMAAIGELGLEGRVVRAGRVSADDRDGLLKMAAAMVFPSEYEGFGAPVIEAMTLGAPVICSDCTCLPEIAGDAAIVLALHPDAWAGALDDATRRRELLVAAGLARATNFTAQRSAEALLRAYSLALA